MRIETQKTRDEIEHEIEQSGYSLLHEHYDDQIWINENKDSLIWLSWINANVKYYQEAKIPNGKYDIIYKWKPNLIFSNEKQDILTWTNLERGKTRDYKLIEEQCLL